MGCEAKLEATGTLKQGLKKHDKCLKCSRQAKVLLPYGPQKFCEKHFVELIEKRFRKTVRRYSLIKRNEKLVVAVSGGKDSLTALYLTNKFFRNSNKIVALLIDEGIKGYRDRALKLAVKNCRAWEIPYKLVKFKDEFGFTMSTIYKKMKKSAINLGSPCAFCGTLRRTVMNRYAKRLHADKLITGHNLDDELQSILMNACDNDLARFLRCGPISGVKSFKQFVQRVKPLCEIPENEIILYADFVGIEHYSDYCCPFRSEAKRNAYRRIIDSLEEQYPGTKFSLWNFYMQIKPVLLKNKSFAELTLNECSRCSEPTTGKLCDTCRKLALLRKL
ncbi:MAG: TIGR00269 family protein [Candidatus Diapherotrites archaeon]|nr:TIGR00269 family protein [Candidatus Diapherotrites archaeon]